jgi:hypothetical protein
MDAMSAMLRTYLQDHHAGATVGVELARRAARSNSETEYGPELARLAEEIAEDRETLEGLMEELGAGSSRVKDSAAWAAEKVGRLKPNNSWLAYSPLSRVVELEGLLIGVTGKLALWQSLRVASGNTVGRFDLAALSERAQDQRARLERLREQAAAEAFTGD